MGKKEEIAKRVWTKLFHLKEGDIVKVVRNLTIHSEEEDDNIGRIGKITDDDISRRWKKIMIQQVACYPPEILGERMVAVRLQNESDSRAFRVDELEKMTDGKEED